jgi:glycosyltransferase involved in cell wall biosynthesis
MAICNLAIFTICSNNYVPMAKVLVESAKRHHPDATLYLCLADEILTDSPQFYPSQCEVVCAELLDIPEFRDFAFRYDIMEFNTAVKPFMFRALLGRGHDAVLYFDPDIEVFAPLEDLLALLDDGASFVLTPHLTRPQEGETFPDDIGIMQAGVFNLGFLGVGAGAEADSVLRWWSRRLQYQCISEQHRGIFVDQKFMDLVPGFAKDARVLRDTGYNVAYWNLPQRVLTQDGRNWLVDGRPLRFFHFSGLAPRNLSRLSKYTDAYRDNEITPALRALMSDYAQQVLKNGHGTIPQGIYAYGRFASGKTIPDIVRWMFRERHLTWSHGDPFETYEEYLHLPVAGQWLGSSACMVTNLMDYLRQREPWLRTTYDLDTRDGVEGFSDWFVNHAGTLVEERRLIEPVAERAGRRSRSGVMPRRVPVQRTPCEPDVDVVGYLRLALGLGEAGRQMLRTLVHIGLNARGLPIQLNSNSDRVHAGDDLEPLLQNEAKARIQIFNVNADQLPQVVTHLKATLRPDAYRVMVPFWELEKMPEPWLDAFDLVDEVWAPTRFIQAMLARVVKQPVLHMPLLMDFEAPPASDRSVYGLPDDRFLFFFAFDFFSSIDRKNPLAVVRAFKRAFRGAGAHPNVGLVLKTLNADHVPERSRALRDALREDPDIALIEGTLARTEVLGLIGACDAVVSLHRSEGLGLLVAEGMALGKPVIATDYSGSTELVSPRTAWPVDFKRIPVGQGEYPYHEGQVWADADVDHAAWQMRRVFEDRPEAERRAAVARAHLREEYGLDACGRRILNRLSELDRR